MRFTLGGFFLFLVLGSVAGIHESAAGDSIRLVTFNLGSARMSGLGPDCPNFKLCDPEVIKEARALFSRVRPDVALFQEVQGEEQLVGNSGGGPLLPEGYKAHCVAGHAVLFKEVCFAWNTKRARLIEECKSVKEQNSGALRCRFEVAGREADFINVHPFAHDPIESGRLLNSVWRDLVREENATVLGGDFNTSKCTGYSDCSVPYPSEFGTLFGYQVAHYGRFSPKNTFYGMYRREEKSGRLIPIKSYSTVYRFKLDHVFTNFGEAAERKYESNVAEVKPCPDGVSTANRLNFRHPLSLGRKNGWRVDHFPILTCIHSKD